LTKYDDLLVEVRTKVGAFVKSTAKEYIPKMYYELRNENPNFTPKDARDRIEKDCCDIWTKRTILDALPDEAKDPNKQKAGRLGQKEHNSAAVSAAPYTRKREEIVIDTEGQPIEDSTFSTTAPVASASDDKNQLKDNDDLLQFEFSLPSKDVFKLILDLELKHSEEDKIWINGFIDRGTGEVSSPALGRISQETTTGP
jgi:hypothetical protein